MIFLQNVRDQLAGKRTAFAEDLRKLGIYAIGLGLVAFIVAGDRITEKEALIIEVAGLIMWVMGLFFSEPQVSGD